MKKYKKLMMSFRFTIVVLVHVVLAVVSFVFAFLVRFDFDIPYGHLATMYRGMPLFVFSMILAFWPFGLFGGMWRYVTVQDVEELIKATTLGTLIFVQASYTLWHGGGLPRSIIFLSWAFYLGTTASIRLLTRLFRERLRPIPGPNAKEIVIVGAGDAGAAVAKEILAKFNTNFVLIGFLDDDIHKHGLTIVGKPVLGHLNILPELVSERNISEALISLPSASGKQLRRIIDICAEAKVHPKVLPGLSCLIDGRVSLNNFRDVSIEDLLRREPVELEEALIQGAITGQHTVMVTGAGGSIGSELSRQIASRKPKKLILFERAESPLYEIDKELSSTFPELEIVPFIGDITDPESLDSVFGCHNPQVVFHAAAYKHVPMMELNECQAVINNVLGSRCVSIAAHEHNCERFVQVSTDKAINPSSVMGATKRIAELFVQALSRKSDCKFMTVRFGNVLGSVGSVIPLFKRQISEGGPVTVTHPEMRRYFMTIPEACQLVLQAATMGEGGEIFILEMGEPVRIYELAVDLINLSGLTLGDDIDIVFTGIRPGEKLYEETMNCGEGIQSTHHSAIVVAKADLSELDCLEKKINVLIDKAEKRDNKGVRNLMSDMLPTNTLELLNG